MQYDKGMNKAYSALTVKSFDEAEGIFIGIASTPAPDRTKDIVEPKGAVFNLPIPLLAYHDHTKVIGTVEQATITDKGIEVVCRVLKDLTNEAREIWSLIQAGALKGLSIGFKSLENEPLANGGFRFKRFEWLELSVVPVAMNAQASITTTKSAVQSIEVSKSMTISEQIQSFRAKRAEVAARMNGLITKGVVLQGDDEAAYQADEAEVKRIDTHLARLAEAEQNQIKSAQPIIVGHVPHITVVDNAPKGRDYVRFVKAMALSRGNPMQAVEIAKNLNYGDRVQTVLKAAVSAGSTTDAGFSVLVEPALMAGEFIDLLRPNLILSKMTQARAVPSNIRIPRATTGTSTSWIGEGKPAPLTNAAFGDLEIGEHKIGAICVFTEELLKRSEPAAENLVRDDLLATIGQAIDLAFIDQANAGVAGVKPASIANGATTAATAGVTAAHVRTDVKAAYLAAVNAGQPLSSGVWVMHPSTALALSMMVHATSGQREFPGVDFVNGGTFEGLPVIVSTNVPGTAVAGYDMVLAIQSEILVAEGGLVIDASREASLEMDSAPTHDSKTPTAAQLVSLWQTGSVAIKAIRGITWTKRRPTAVYRVSAAKYA